MQRVGQCNPALRAEHTYLHPGGVLLENAINQDFEVPGVVVVRGNKVFLSDLNLGTRNRFEALMKSMGVNKSA